MGGSQDRGNLEPREKYGEMRRGLCGSLLALAKDCVGLMLEDHPSSGFLEYH